jgi:hypothetical protein
MFKHLLILSAFVVSSMAVAHADPISGFFSAAGGTDTFDSSSITFTPNTAVVGGATGGTFATYLTAGDAITFLSGALPYHDGFNTPPNPPFTTGMVPLFSTQGNGETFTFEMTDYTAGFITDGSGGCGTGSTCLNVTGDGTFVGTGAFDGQSGPASFTFTSQYSPGAPIGSVTTFSASASAVPSQVPEPASLALFGTGLLGIVGIARRKLKV